MATLWRSTTGKIIVSAAGKPIDCVECPCGGGNGASTPGEGDNVLLVCCGVTIIVPGTLYVVINDPSNNLGCGADGSTFPIISMPNPGDCGGNPTWRGTLALPSACGCTGQSTNNFMLALLTGVTCGIDWCATVGPPNCYLWDLNPVFSVFCTLPFTLANQYLNIGGVQSGPFDLEIIG